MKTPTVRRGVEVTLRWAGDDHSACLGCECQHRVPSIDQLRRESAQMH